MVRANLRDVGGWVFSLGPDTRSQLLIVLCDRYTTAVIQLFLWLLRLWGFTSCGRGTAVQLFQRKLLHPWGLLITHSKTNAKYAPCAVSNYVIVRRESNCHLSTLIPTQPQKTIFRFFLNYHSNTMLIILIFDIYVPLDNVSSLKFQTCSIIMERRSNKYVMTNIIFY